jgi:2-keto-4-pentenoate hydratase/2-oxohepta-3-ene-1,7-dioic acid hydratase in catechol pathway
MVAMKFITFRKPSGPPQAGVLVEDRVISLAGAGFSDMFAILTGGALARAKVDNWVYQPSADDVFSLSSVKLLAPIPRPPKFICVGLNYRDHAAETGMEIPKTPTIFSKFSNVVIGPGDPIVLPANSTRPDYEAELAFIIGKGGRHIAAQDWREHVFGYTIVNDVSARDFQMATSQWLLGKTFDTFAPMGPAIVTEDEIADPHALEISLEIGGEILQKSNTRELIFQIPEILAHISSVVTLEPGDIVATGTPAGVGFARKPPRYLQPGDEVIIQIQGLGELRNPCVAESTRSA